MRYGAEVVQPPLHKSLIDDRRTSSIWINRHRKGFFEF
jgi:hypothetical protein